MASVKSISDIIKEVSPYYKKKDEAEATHTLVYDSSSETLEPIYFWILDLMNDFGLAPEKLIDNFVSSPGSGHFSELGGKATQMQQQASKILADIGIITRGILNVIYDLKEFRIRLDSYEGLKDEKTKEAATLSLKQIWMDKVDIQKGNSSIKAMALGQAGFQTLIDAFLASKDIKDVDKLDLNDRVKRILKPRILEFNSWLKNSEKELSKRYKLERTYLRSQVNSLKLYSRWVRPYLKIAQDLEAGETGRRPELVKTFNTILLELTLLGKNLIDVKSSAIAGDLPKDFIKLKTKRDYFSCVLVDFVFRGIPQRVAQQSHFVFGGRAEVTFSAYALNQEELDKINQELEKSDIASALTLIEGATGETLKNLQDEIDYFLAEDEIEEKKEKSSGANPFLALFGKYNKDESKKSKDKEDDKKITSDKPVRPDNFIEKEHLRSLAAANATESIFLLFDVYKKAHGMASYA